MIGQGTKENPYIIMNWDDFFNVDGDTADTYYKLGANLDGNDYNDGIFGDNHEIHANIDGAGFEIRNILNTRETQLASNGLFSIGEIPLSWKNIKFVNIQTNENIFWHMGSGLAGSVIENCEIDAFCLGIGGNYSGITFSKCKLSLECQSCIGNSERYSDSYKIRFEYCSLNAKITLPENHCMNVDSLSSELIIDCGETSVAGTSNYTLVLYGYNVLRIKTGGRTTSGKTYYYIRQASGISIMDDDLPNEAILSINGNVAKLSTSDMKNSDAVRATGFPVMVVTKE